MRRLSLALLLLGCHDRRSPYDIASMTAQLAAAGYVVTPAPVARGIGPVAMRRGVTNVSCIDARRAGTTDTFCVIRCTDDRVCGDLLGQTGESYGDFQRGASILVHEECARTAVSFDCVAARKAIGIL